MTAAQRPCCFYGWARNDSSTEAVLLLRLGSQMTAVQSPCCFYRWARNDSSTEAVLLLRLAEYLAVSDRRGVLLLALPAVPVGDLVDRAARRLAVALLVRVAHGD